MDDGPGPLRVLSWNIHGCVGTDGRRDAERIGAAVRTIGPDIAAFQEVDTRQKPGSRRDMHGFLRDLVGEHGFEGWALSGADGDYGQVLASRFPLAERRVHDITVLGREPRRALEARIDTPAGPLRIIATHLGLRTRERLRQFARLREIVDRDGALPVLLMGDLNEWRSDRLHRALSGLFGSRTDHRTFPSRLPLIALDRIMCRPGSMLTALHATRHARAASDHLPVVADIALPAGDQAP